MGQVNRKFVAKPCFQRFLQALPNILAGTIFPRNQSYTTAAVLRLEIDAPGAGHNIGCAARGEGIPACGRSGSAWRIFKRWIEKRDQCTGGLFAGEEPWLQQGYEEDATDFHAKFESNGVVTPNIRR